MEILRDYEVLHRGLAVEVQNPTREVSGGSEAQAGPRQLHPGSELFAWPMGKANVGVVAEFLHSCAIPSGLVHRQMIDVKIAQVEQVWTLVFMCS